LHFKRAESLRLSVSFETIARKMDLTPRKSIDEENNPSELGSMIDTARHSIVVERTLALIKPDAVQKTNDIENLLLAHGFTILQVTCEQHWHVI
jgi:hypothetical protein